ncbi:hypothetical protein BVRB_2g036350 [Beta vulgaris subsp. vulgaris]|nr:hypothetical protein BVRB_2g036350 [Beta vulgaris subsp. vulgaris]
MKTRDGRTTTSLWLVQSVEAPRLSLDSFETTTLDSSEMEEQRRREAPRLSLDSRAITDDKGGGGGRTGEEGGWRVREKRC